MGSRWCCVLSLLGLVWEATAKIVVAGVLPHGDFVFDPSLVHNENGSVALHGNATLLAARIEVSKPDIVFLSSPHGLESTTAFTLYRNTNSRCNMGVDLYFCMRA